MDNTTLVLLDEIKQRAMIPASQQTWSDTSILQTATQEMDLYIVPLLINSREEFFTWEVPQTVTSRIVPINERAIGGNLRALFYTNGLDNNYINIPYLDPDQRARANNGGTFQLMFYLEWNKIKLTGNIAQLGQLIQVIYMRPGRFIQTIEGAQIIAIDTLTNTVTCSFIPQTFAPGLVVDWISNRQMHQYLRIDDVIQNVTLTDLTFTTLPDGLQVGDWICPRYQSTVVQTPPEIFPLLCQKTAVTILQSLGDPKWKDANDELMRLEKAAINLINPRVHGEDKVIVSNMENRRWVW